MDDAWHHHDLEHIVHGLRHAFTKASEIRQKHLVAVDKRKDMLNKIGAIIRDSKGVGATMNEIAANQAADQR